MQLDDKLPHLAERLRAGQPVRIVAIGGASTTGLAAGSSDLAYPHRLQEILARWYPSSSITVVNRGVPRQTAQQMLERFPTDVIPEDPVLVIWETVTTDGVRRRQARGTFARGPPMTAFPPSGRFAAPLPRALPPRSPAFADTPAAQIPPNCAAPPALSAIEAALDRTSSRILSGQPLTIVAMGSSSTLGVGGAPRLRAIRAVSSRN